MTAIETRDAPVPAAIEPKLIPLHARLEFPAVLAAELDQIKRPGQRDSLVGLALSGGGIRSASFALGVIQALKKFKRFDDLDYLSTVSGGGYTGSALTWFREKGFPGYANPSEGPDFPFGQIGVGGRTEDRDKNCVLDFIRQHASYLTPGKGINLISVIGVVLRGMFVSFAVYLALLTAVFIPAARFGAFDRPLPTDLLGGLANVRWEVNYLLWAALATVAGLIVAALYFSVRTIASFPGPRDRYERFVASQRLVGWGWVLAMGLAVAGLLPVIAEYLGTVWATLTAGAATGGGGLLGLLQFKRQQTPGATEGAFGNARAILGAAALVYGILLLAYLIATFVAGRGDWVFWFGGILAGGVVFGLLVNLNYSGLHRMYRDRLMEAFLPNADNVIANEWGRATDAEDANLEQMCRRRPRPYQLINTNVVLVDSGTSKFRGRGGDSFVLSPLYCGSYATGWRSTATYMKKGGKTGMTLATAMAISGAAVNPQAGVGGKGLTRNRMVSILLSFLNLRLGYWAPSPRLNWSFVPNYLTPGVPGLLSKGYEEGARALELTDGGHFENLGLYELVRRRVKTIIVSDAGADPQFQFTDLANAVERVRVDFGVKIRFEEDRYPLSEVVSTRHEGHRKFAQRGYAIGWIVYPPTDDHAQEMVGALVYIKSTMIDYLPADIVGYEKTNETFPDQSTADQFFDEDQFEAYRELGYQLTKRMFEENKGTWPTPQATA